MIELKVCDKQDGFTRVDLSIEGIGDQLISETAVGIYSIANRMGDISEKQEPGTKAEIELDTYSAAIAYYIAQRTGANPHTNEGQNFVKGMEFAAKQFIDMNINLNSLDLDELQIPDPEADSLMM